MGFSTLHSHPLKAEPITGFSPAFADCQDNIQNDPSSALAFYQQLDDTSLSQVDWLQKRYCLALAQQTLVYPAQALGTINEALAQANIEAQPWLYHQLALEKASILAANAQYAPALLRADQVVAWARGNSDKRFLVDALLVRATIKMSLTDYIGAQEDCNESTLINQTVNDPNISASIANRLASIHEYRREYQLAINYYQEVIDYDRIQNNQNALSINLYGLGYNHRRLKNYQLAQQALQESLDIAEQIDDQQGVAYALKELALISLANGKADQAEKQLLNALGIASLSSNSVLKLNCHLYLIDVYLQLRNIDKARISMIAAEQLLDPIALPSHHLTLEEARAKVMFAQGQHQQAFDQLISLQEKRQQVYDEQSTKQLLQLQTTFQLKEKEHENTLLTQKNTLTKMQLASARSQNKQLTALITLCIIVVGLLVYIHLHNRRTRQKLIRLAHHDSLTKLYNRRRVLELIEGQLKLAQRHQQPLTIGIIDIDYFKQVNDNFGHPTGDKVLQLLAQLMTKLYRETDLIGRIGGEEFVICFPQTNAVQAKKAIKKLHHQARAIAASAGMTDKTLTFSCGLCEVSAQITLQSMLAAADEALYRAKEQGRDRTIVAAI